MQWLEFDEDQQAPELESDAPLKRIGSDPTTVKDENSDTTDDERDIAFAAFDAAGTFVAPWRSDDLADACAIGGDNAG